VELVLKNVKIPKPMWKDCEKLIKLGKYASDSELIRDALRKLLEEKQELLEERVK